MATPWIFTPNVFASIWYSPSDPQTDPPDSVGLDCQQLKPFYTARGITTPVMIHRMIFRQTDLGSLGSTQLVAGMWVLLFDWAGNQVAWFDINDISPMPYVDPINGPTIDLLMVSGNLANF